MTRCLTAATCLSLAFASAAFAADNPKRGMSLVDQKVASMTPPADSKAFAMMAAEGGLFEVKLAQLAGQKAQSDQVKSLARMIEQEHTQANNELMAVAKQKNMPLPTELGEDKQAMLEAFSRLQGMPFDQAFMLHNIKDHLHHVMLFRKEAQNGTDADVKAWATKTLPALQRHTAHIAQVAQGVQIPVDALMGGNARGAHGTDAVPAGSRIEGTNSSTGAGSTGTTGSGTGTSGSGSGTGSGTGTGGSR